MKRYTKKYVSFLLSVVFSVAILANTFIMAVNAGTRTDDGSLNPDSAAAAVLKEKLSQAEDILSDYIFKNVLQNGEFVPGIDSSDAILATYYVYSLRQAGYENEAYYQKVYNNIENQLKNTTDLSAIEGDYGVSSYAKLVMLVTALGHDATNVGGVNLVEKLTSKETVAASSTYLRETTLLLAMSVGNYKFPLGEAFVSEQEMINAVLGQVDSAIADSMNYGCDMAAMVIQGLWRYYGTNADVKTACDKVILFLENAQEDNGYFSDSYTTNNVWTTAQVMMTMNIFGKSAVSEADGSNFIKNGKTVIDSMLEYFDLENRTVSDTIKGYDPAQVLRGISATMRSLNGEKNIFDCEIIRDANEQPQAPENQEPPQTGDNTNIFVLLVLMVFSGTMAVVCLIKREGENQI